MTDKPIRRVSAPKTKPLIRQRLNSLSKDNIKPNLEKLEVNLPDKPWQKRSRSEFVIKTKDEKGNEIIKEDTNAYIIYLESELQALDRSMMSFKWVIKHLISALKPVNR